MVSCLSLTQTDEQVCKFPPGPLCACPNQWFRPRVPVQASHELRAGLDPLGPHLPGLWVPSWAHQEPDLESEIPETDVKDRGPCYPSFHCLSPPSGVAHRRDRHKNTLTNAPTPCQMRPHSTIL